MASMLNITDAEAVRRINQEKKRRGDKTAARTATKVILEYFALIDGRLAKSAPVTAKQ